MEKKTKFGLLKVKFSINVFTQASFFSWVYQIRFLYLYCVTFFGGRFTLVLELWGIRNRIRKFNYEIILLISLSAFFCQVLNSIFPALIFNLIPHSLDLFKAYSLSFTARVTPNSTKGIKKLFKRE